MIQMSGVALEGRRFVCSSKLLLEGLTVARACGALLQIGGLRCKPNKTKRFSRAHAKTAQTQCQTFPVAS